MKRNKIAVSLVEDEKTTRGLLAQWVRLAKEFELVGTHASGEDALESLPKENPNVILMDVNLPGISGIECVQRLKPLLPAAQFVMLTVYIGAEHVFRAFAAGASGYLVKSSARTEIVEAIRDAHHGGAPISKEIAHCIVKWFQQHGAQSDGLQLRPSDTQKLSPRQQEIMELLARGYLYKEIANSLAIANSTVKGYIHRIYEKLHVNSRGKAVASLLKSEAWLSTGIDLPPSTLRKHNRHSQKDIKSTKYAQFEDLNEMLAEIVGGFCHDIGNCLSACTAISHDLGNKTLRQRCVEAERILSEMHDFARGFYLPTAASDMVLNWQRLKQFLLELCGRIPCKSRISFKICATNLAPSFRFPRILLRNLIMPLVNNSVEAIELAGKKRAHITIDLSESPIESTLQILIADNGPGWGRNVQELQMAVTQGERISTKGERRGYGLQNVFRLTKRLKGEVRLFQNRNSGASVTILLPKKATL